MRHLAFGRVWFAVLIAVLGRSPALAQCVVQYDARIDPPAGFGGGEGSVVVKGTYDCGVAKGTLCGSGSYSGDCTTSTNSLWTVSCDGACEAIPGDTPESVTCDGPTVWQGRTEGTCSSGVCESEARGADGTRSWSIAIADADSLQAGLQDCGAGGAGVSDASYVGVTTIPLPVP